MQHILDTVGHLEAARSSLLNAMHDATAVESLWKNNQPAPVSQPGHERRITCNT